MSLSAWLIVAYFLCLPLGFVLAASKKGVWWGHTYCDGSPIEDQEHWFAILVTIFYPITFVYLFGESLLRQLSHVFMSLMEKTIYLMSKTSDWLAQRKAKKVAETPIRKRIATPSPVVNPTGYREAAPKPCIACGTPTSVDQSHMEVIEDEDSNEETYRGFATHPPD